MARKPDWFKDFERSDFHHLKKDVIWNKRLTYLTLALLSSVVLQTDGVEGLIALVLKVVGD